MEAYPRAAMERAMKVQDVMLQAMAKKITWWQAAEILGISDRGGLAHPLHHDKRACHTLRDFRTVGTTNACCRRAKRRG
jgi:hypothetical protein